MPLPGGSGVRRSIINYTWCHDKTHDGFMGDKSRATVDILALTVTLFCLVCDTKATPCMRRMSAFWAIHHFRFSAAASEVSLIIHNINIKNQLFNIEIINFHFQFDAGRKSAIRVDRVRQRCDGPFGIINGLFKAADLHGHFRIEIRSAFCQLQGK